MLIAAVAIPPPCGWSRSFSDEETSVPGIYDGMEFSGKISACVDNPSYRLRLRRWRKKSSADGRVRPGTSNDIQLRLLI